MNLLWGLLIIVVVDAIAIAAMLLVRRRAPEGSFFADGDRASGVFGVLATVHLARLSKARANSDRTIRHNLQFGDVLDVLRTTLQVGKQREDR